jgi:hypothetical protein
MIKKQDGCQNHPKTSLFFQFSNGYCSHLVFGTSENRSGFQITIKKLDRFSNAIQ